jgi:hypothetical protein
MQSIPIITNVVISNSTQAVHYYVLKFVSELRQLGGFLLVLHFTCVDEADTPCSDDNARCASDGGANKCLCKDDYYPKNDSICYDSK